MNRLDAEIERNGAIIRAAEDWAKQYGKDITTHAKLIKEEARLKTKLRNLFKNAAANSGDFINWNSYTNQVNAAFDVSVIVQDTALAALGQEFITVAFDHLNVMTALGAQASEAIYSIPLGITSQDAIIQQLTKDRVASLVGMSVTKDGSIVTNPRAGMSITDTIRNDIVESIKTSLALGETKDDASSRIESIIGNPRRSETIAQTESVNAYQAGVTEFGKQSGAVGKEWQDVDAVDVCADYADEGPVEFDYLFGGELDGPAAHPNCRCGRRLIYQQEWDELNG